MAPPRGRPGPVSEPPTLFTIGHSSHRAEVFLTLLERHAIEAVADVRSTPYSRRHPQFNRKTLAATLEAHGIHYVFLGEELGARAKDPSVYRDGKVDYERLAATELFRTGIERLLDGAKQYRIAVMCAEKEPLDCHRAILVARELARRGASVRHILANGEVETHEELEERLLRRVRREPLPLFAAEDRAAALELAYAVRGRAIAYPATPGAEPRRRHPL